MPYKNKEERNKRQKEIREQNPEQFRKRERAYYRRHSKEINERKRVQRTTDEFRAKRRARYRLKKPQQTAEERLMRACHQRITRAIHDGLMSRQPCRVCGVSDTEAHHEDYSKPYDVIWLCQVHHRRLHKSKEGYTVSDLNQMWGK
jgi:hypothetical protein